MKAACTVWRGAKGVKAPDLSRFLLSSDYSATYLQQLWKKVRKQGGLCTGISQNVTDLLQNYIASTLISNSEFVALLKQSNIDSAKLSEVIGVSDAQLRFVSNSPSGTGLIKCGSTVIPFDNTIGKDTALYQLYNTNIHEKIALGLSDNVEQSEDDVEEEDTVFMPEVQAKDYVKRLINERKTVIYRLINTYRKIRQNLTRCRWIMNPKLRMEKTQTVG